MYLAYVDEYGEDGTEHPLGEYRGHESRNTKYLMFSAFIIHESDEKLTHQVLENIICKMNNPPENKFLHWAEIYHEGDKDTLIDALLNDKFWNLSVVIDKEDTKGRHEYTKGTFYEESFGHIISEISLACSSISNKTGIDDKKFKIIFSEKSRKKVLKSLEYALKGQLYMQLIYGAVQNDLLYPLDLMHPLPEGIDNISSFSNKSTPGLMFADAIVGSVRDAFYPSKEKQTTIKYVTKLKCKFPPETIHNNKIYKQGVRLIGQKDPDYFYSTKAKRQRLYNMQKQRKSVDKDLYTVIEYCGY